MKKLFFHLLILSVILSSCANFVEDANSAEYRQIESSEKLIKVCGELDFSGAVPAEIRDSLVAVQNDNASRSAIPSIPADAKYVVTANSAGKTPVTKEATYNSESKKYEFEIGLSEGSWNFTAELITADEKVLLTDTDSRILTLENPVVNLSFYLKPLAEGTGDISLTISYNISEVEEIEYVPSAACKAEWDKGTNKSTAPSSGLENFIVEGLKAGSYDITILFKKDGVLVYCTSQTINVLANMTTNSWVSGGGSGPIDGVGSFEVTASLISTFARSTFYVDGTNGSDITGSGGPYSPVKSLSKAVSLADSSMEEGTKSIFVKAGGSETLTATLKFSEDINVEVYTSAVGDRIGQYTVTRPETSESFIEQMVTINSGKTVTLSGIVIDGNKYQGALNGMGIFVSGNILLKNCVVRNCVTTNSGGGIYINGGTVTLDKNTLIGSDSENCATNSEYSNSASAGGGIYVANSGKLFNYGKVSFNYASNSVQYGGGGIYVSGSGYLECSGEICYNRAEFKGGGIYSGKEAVIDECKIFGNEAGDTGGGIWASSNLTLKDSVIKNCSVPEGNKGNGIFLSSVGNNFKIKGSTYIGEESDIFISAGDVITIEENLTPKDENGNEQTTVAYLNISDAQADRNILSATTKALLKENIDKFEIKTPRWGLAQGSGENSTKGQLKPVVYVAGAGSGISGSDTNPGTKDQPLATVAKAVDLLGTNGGTIYIAGTQTIVSGIAITQNYSLQKWPGTTSEAKIQYTSTSYALFQVSASKTLKISNIDIEGPDVPSSQAGAAIYNSGTLILNNVNLSNFKQATGGDKYGGCLYNAGDGTISITGGSITSCVSAQGGAIYNDGKDIEIKDCTINSCEVGQAGGAIYNHSSAKITLSGNTLIGVDASTKATSSSYGNASTAGQGGGIYLENGELYLKDNTVIGKNYSASAGGGVYLASGAKVYLQDNASIKNCTSNSNGGGIYLGADVSSAAKAFLQDNVSITSCTANNGSGIYASAAMCRVYMKDSAYLDSASDIRLNANGYVSLNGDLTPPVANGIAATLTPQFYNVDDEGYPCEYTLLQEDSTGLIARNYTKFKVTPKASGEYVIPYCINSAGKLAGISQASLAELVSSFNSSNKYLITITDPNPDFTILYDALKKSSSQFKLDLSQTSITTLASDSLHDMNKMIDVSFPSTLTTLEAGSIYSLSSSLTIKIPASVTTITGNPFAKLTASIRSDTSCNITLEEGNLNYKMIDGVIYTKDGKRLVCYPKSKTNTTFTIPAGVEVIGEGAFAGNSKLTEVTFNDGLKKIENYAFAKLTENKKVVLPASVTSIGDYSFYCNYKIETLTITGGQLYTIGKQAFSYFGLSAQGASKDCKVTIGEGISEIGEDAFYCCYIDTSSDDPLVLPASLTVIGGSNFRNGKANYIKSLAVNPPVVGNSGLYSNNILGIYVPSSSVNAYKNAEPWKDYTISGF